MTVMDIEFLIAYLGLQMFTSDDVRYMTRRIDQCDLYEGAEAMLKDWAEWL